MEFDIKPSWLDMSERKLHALFTRKKYPQKLVAGRVALIQKLKAERRAQRLRHHTQDRLWKALLDPAREELGVLRTMKAKLKRAPETPATQRKYEVLHAYETAITRTIERLRAVQKSRQYTPAQLVKVLHAEKKLPEEVTGKHWADFVPPKKREEIERMFAALPEPVRGRKKTPFERSFTRAERRHQLKLLWDSIQEEYDDTQAALLLTKDEDKRAQLEAYIEELEQAKFKWTQIKATAPVPENWRQL